MEIASAYELDGNTEGSGGDADYCYTVGEGDGELSGDGGVRDTDDD